MLFKRQNLIDYSVLFFLVLISLTIIFGLNDRTKVSGLYAIALDIRGTLNRPLWYGRQLIRMNKEVRQLQHENALLRIENSEYKEAYYENIRLRKILSFDLRKKFKGIPAKVLGKNDIAIHTLVIGVGKDHGVKVNMPVVSADGLVGKILHSGRHTSSVHLISDRNFRVAVRDQQSRVEGVFEWTEGRQGKMSAVHHSADIQTGHNLITSGMSALFPAGLNVGRVNNVDTTASALFRKVEVELYVDFDRLEEVFVITSHTPAEQ